MNQAAADLLDMLLDYSDDSDLQPPIKRGDVRHATIVAYRNSLGRRFGRGEASFMRRLLDLSRSRKLTERRESQEVAGEWADQLEKKYGEPGAIPPEVIDKLTPSDVACAKALTDKPQRGHEVADAAGVEESTARRSLSKLKKLTTPLAELTPKGYIRSRPK